MAFIKTRGPLAIIWGQWPQVTESLSMKPELVCSLSPVNLVNGNWWALACSIESNCTLCSVSAILATSPFSNWYQNTFGLFVFECSRISNDHIITVSRFEIDKLVHTRNPNLWQPTWATPSWKRSSPSLPLTIKQWVYSEMMVLSHGILLTMTSKKK